MVIQSNMSPEQIINVWSNTKSIFHKLSVSITDRPLSDTLPNEGLIELLQVLNEAVGSTSNTCVEGG